jgi:DNA-binding transcriptional LysR family regulator
MELRHLRYFVTVAEELHFGRAALRLNMSQPPLSRQIQELEDELGFALFVREYHKVDLTDAGKVYLAQVTRILEQLGAAGQEAAGVALGRTGHLRIGHGTHMPEEFFPRLLAAFHEVAPRVAIDLLETPTPRIMKALHEKTIDVGFVLTPSDRAGLVVEHLMRESLLVALPEGHRLTTAPLVSLAQLAQENFVLCRRYESQGYRELVEGICREAGFTPRVLQSVETKQTVLDLVAAGLGVSIVQESVASSHTRGICYRAMPKPEPHVDTSIVWREDAQPEIIRLLVDAAQREAAVRRSTCARQHEGGEHAATATVAVLASAQAQQA